MDVKKIEDHKFDDLKLKLEAEIENLQKYVKPAELSIEELEKVEPLDEKKIKDFKDEIELLEKEIKERKDKIDLIDKEVKLRVEVREMIDNALKDLDFEDEDVHSFLHQFTSFAITSNLKKNSELMECLQLDDEGLPIEVVKEVKHIPWDKESVLKDLKLKLDLDKANHLVRSS
jgi:DNA polymerase sigma